MKAIYENYRRSIEMTFVKGDAELEYCGRNWNGKCIICGRLVTFGSEAITYHGEDQVTIVVHGRCADELLRVLLQDRLANSHYAGTAASWMKTLAFQYAKLMESNQEIHERYGVPKVAILGTNTEC